MLALGLLLSSLSGCGSDRQGNAPAPAKPPGQAGSYALEPVWEQKLLAHQFEAYAVFTREGFIYVGSGGPEGQVSKVDMATGKTAWSHKTGQSYQPSFPVSNGRMVIYGEYYNAFIVGLSDETGKELWKVPTKSQNMSAATFADDLAFIGSYDKHLHAIDWAKGTVRWKTELGAEIWSRPCAWQGLILVGCYDGFLYSLERTTGNIAWKLNCGGRICWDLVLAGDLVFVGVDGQWHDEKYDPSKIGQTIMVIDLNTKQVLARFATGPGGWSRRIIVEGNDVYFFSPARLCSFDLKARKLSWQFDPGQSVLGYPLVCEKAILLPMNAEGREGQHRENLIVLSRSTGEVLQKQESGGIGMNWPEYVQYRDLVISTHARKAYKVTAKAPAPAPESNRH